MKQRLCVCVFFPHYRSFWLETVFDYISQRASLWRTHGGHCVPRVSAVGPVNPSDASKLQTSTSCVSLCCGAIAGRLRKQLMGFLRIVSNCVIFLTTIVVMCCWDGVLCANCASCVLTVSRTCEKTRPECCNLWSWSVQRTRVFKIWQKKLKLLLELAETEVLSEHEEVTDEAQQLHDQPAQSR